MICPIMSYNLSECEIVYCHELDCALYEPVMKCCSIRLIPKFIKIKEMSIDDICNLGNE